LGGGVVARSGAAGAPRGVSARRGGRALLTFNACSTSGDEAPAFPFSSASTRALAELEPSAMPLMNDPDPVVGARVASAGPHPEHFAGRGCAEAVGANRGRRESTRWFWLSKVLVHAGLRLTPLRSTTALRNTASPGVRLLPWSGHAGARFLAQVPELRCAARGRARQTVAPSPARSGGSPTLRSPTTSAKTLILTASFSAISISHRCRSVIG